MSATPDTQVGISVELLRVRWLGGFAAWCGLTLPSILLPGKCGHDRSPANSSGPVPWNQSAKGGAMC
ncbi:hypothetical protein BZM27_48565 [Paraburkholderia steynii]|uniref:Uncharacterized protein n=1 Tax=Paraburkholderia steynii TaxID=1245441 RepID=A0A4R0X0C0_9BURK|nr:hypothetical protein BZM27_48565 [Paraburkholderia steynii]